MSYPGCLTNWSFWRNSRLVDVSDLVHDNTARVNWKLAVIESLNKGGDGMIRSANIRTTTGRTNRPTARLYPLEVTAPEMTVKPSSTEAFCQYNRFHVKWKVA